MRRGIAALVLIGATLAPAAPASARVTEQYAYSYDQLWRSAVRLIAVDFRFRITDRDPEIGYLLFQYREQGRDYDGSLELVRTRDRRGQDQVRIALQIQAMPTYVERMMIDRLSRKLGEDYGAPPPPPRPAPPPPARAEEPDDEDEEREDREHAPRDQAR